MPGVPGRPQGAHVRPRPATQAQAPSPLLRCNVRRHVGRGYLRRDESGVQQNRAGQRIDMWC
eukprot:COSAG01_NODE_7405_length_3220_cov_6.542031_3_plen_62_part_00